MADRGNRPPGVRPHGTKGKYHGKSRGYGGSLSDAAKFEQHYGKNTPKGKILVAKIGGYKAGDKLVYRDKKAAPGTRNSALASGTNPLEQKAPVAQKRPVKGPTTRGRNATKLYGRTKAKR